MSITSAIRRGASAVQSAYARQKRDAEERASRRMASARTKLEKEKVRISLEREKVKLERELADAELALAKEKEALAKAKSSSRKSGSGLGKRVVSGWKALEKWYDRGGTRPRKRKSAKRKVATKRG